MPIEIRIDCPAIHNRSSSYPFGERVPRTVRTLKPVTADPMPGIGLAYIKGDPPVAKLGQTYPVWTNSYAAVTAVMEDGTRLGLRPEEFEVDSWHHLAAEPAPQPHPEPIAWSSTLSGTTSRRTLAATGTARAESPPTSCGTRMSLGSLKTARLPAQHWSDSYDAHLLPPRPEHQRRHRPGD